MPLSSALIASRPGHGPRTAGDQLLQAIDRAGEVVPVLGDGVDHRVEAVDQLLDGLAVVGQ